MKNLLPVILAFVFFVPVTRVFSETNVDGISAQSYVCMSAETAQILCGRDMFLQRGIASTTKLMTAVLAVESGRLNEIVEIDERLIRAEGTSLGLKDGDKLSLYELVKGMLLSSGNDSANAVAYHISGSLESFACLMNNKARELCMNNTVFVTPSGLDAEGQHSCAYDMAILARYAVNDPVICEMTAMKDTYVAFSDGRRLFVANHNKLLLEVDGCFGLKTGFTKKSGRCLVSAAKRNGKTVIVVTLGAPDDWNDHKKLYEAAFAEIDSFEYSYQRVFSVNVVGGKDETVCCVAEDEPVVSGFYVPDVKVEYNIEPFLYAPVKEGDVVGKATLYSEGRILKTVCISAAGNVDAKGNKLSLVSDMTDRIVELFRKWKIIKSDFKSI